MKQMLKRFVALALALILVFTAAPTAYAARLETEGRKVRYGTIEVIGVGKESAETYRAARDDDNGIVYIHADDFADIVGGTLSKSGKDEDMQFQYSISTWKVHVYTEKGYAQVFYDFDLGAGSGIGYMLYDEFELTDCLYDELNDTWYFPFEEMLYMMAMQWFCQNGIVFIYQPETLLDVLLDFEDMHYIAPSYSDLMGEEGWERWNASWNYAWTSAIDDIDMTFVLDGAASAWNSAWGEEYYTSHEKETMMDAMLLLQHDLPSTGSTTLNGMDWITDFIGVASTAMDLSSTETGFPITAGILGSVFDVGIIPSEMDTISAGAAVGAPLLGYLLNIGQTKWIREHISSDLSGRLTYIETKANERAEDNPFWKLLAEQAAETRSTYCADIADSYDGMSLDSIMTVMDGLLQLDQGSDWKDKLTGDIADVIADVAPDSAGAAIGTAGAGVAAGLTILNWMNLTVGTIDLCVEVAKVNSPAFADALELGENAHLCRYLIKIVEMLGSESRSAVQELRACGGMNQELLDEIRTSTHLMLIASVHAHDLLSKMDKYTVIDNYFMETEYIMRLIECSKHDKLLLMDENFSDIVSDEDGCVRHDIPVEYVRVIEPVIVTTEKYHDEGEHFYANVAWPHVYSEANPSLTEAVDAVLTAAYGDIWETIESSKASAATCSYDMQTHTETLKLEGAYSNGGFLMLSVGEGYFSCSIGHNVYRVTDYLFDIATGQQISLPELLDTEKNPDALPQLLDIMEQKMDETGERLALDHSPSGVTAEDIYYESQGGYGARWSLGPDGIYFAIDALNMDLMMDGFLVPHEDLADILKEEYRPAVFETTATWQIQPFEDSMLEYENLYENTPSVNALILSGQASNVWVEDSYGYDPESITGSCTIFYAFGLQNAIISLPEPLYPQYGYSICWQDKEGNHIETFSAP